MLKHPSFIEGLYVQSIFILFLSEQQPLGEALVIAPAAGIPSTENLFEAMLFYGGFFFLWRPRAMSTHSALRAVIIVSLPQ